MQGFAARNATSPLSAAKGVGDAPRLQVMRGQQRHYGLAHALGATPGAAQQQPQQPPQQSSWVPPAQIGSYAPPPGAQVQQNTPSYVAPPQVGVAAVQQGPPGQQPHGPPHSITAVPRTAGAATPLHSAGPLVGGAVGRSGVSPSRHSPVLRRQQSAAGFQGSHNTAPATSAQAVAVEVMPGPGAEKQRREAAGGGAAAPRHSSGHERQPVQRPMTGSNSYAAPVAQPTRRTAQQPGTADGREQEGEAPRRHSAGHSHPPHRPITSPTNRFRSPVSAKAATATAVPTTATEALPRGSPCMSPTESLRTPRQSQTAMAESRSVQITTGLPPNEQQRIAQATATASAAASAVLRQSSTATVPPTQEEPAEPVRRPSQAQPIPKAVVAAAAPPTSSTAVDASQLSRLQCKEQELLEKEETLRLAEAPLRQREDAVVRREERLHDTQRDVEQRECALRESEESIRRRVSDLEKRVADTSEREAALAAREKSCERLAEDVEAQRRREADVSLREQRLNEREGRFAEREARFAEREVMEATNVREQRERAEQERSKQESWLREREARLNDWEADLRSRERELRAEEEKIRAERKMLDERERQQREAANEAHVFKKSMVLGVRNSRAERISPRTSGGHVKTSLMSEFGAAASKENLQRQLEDQQDYLQAIKRNSNASMQSYNPEDSMSAM